jgi:hypothetical protein
VGNFLLGAIAPLPLNQQVVADNFAVPLLADFQGDPSTSAPTMMDTPRLLYPRKDTGKILFQRRTSHDSRYVRIQPSTAAVGLDTPPTLAPNVYPNAVEAHVNVFRLSPNQFLSPQGRRQLIPISETEGSWTMTMSVEEPYLSMNITTDALVMSTRYVIVDGQGQVTHRWPLRFSAIAFDPTVAASIASLGGSASAVLLGVKVFNPDGITGDVVQPPQGPPDDDENPPRPGG